jgi:predicted amidohydrolase
MQDIKVAAVQADLVWEDHEANLMHFDHLLSELQGDPDLIVLPEMFNTAFSMKPEVFSEPVDGPTLSWVQNKAKALNAAIVASWMVEEDGKYFNRLHFVYPDASFKTYDKRHLFRMGEENEHFSAGDDSLILEFKGWKIKPMVCYDLRFPVWAKNGFNGENYDYDLLIYIANWPAARSKPWRTLLAARAIENQSCLIGVNRIGKDEVGNDYSGHSLIIDAKGEPMAQLEEWKEDVAYATLSYNDLYNFRSKFTVGLDWDRFQILK